jgi:hypothetical protein
MENVEDFEVMSDEYDVGDALASILQTHLINTVERGYNNVGLYDTSSITSDILCYQLIRHC